jgi:hypothetical protein
MFTVVTTLERHLFYNLQIVEFLNQDRYFILKTSSM